MSDGHVTMWVCESIDSACVCGGGDIENYVEYGGYDSLLTSIKTTKLSENGFCNICLLTTFFLLWYKETHIKLPQSFPLVAGIIPQQKPPSTVSAQCSCISKYF